MTPKQRAVTALTGGVPDEVPTFELEFQLAPELLGRDFKAYDGLDGHDLDRAVAFNAELWLEVAEGLEYAIVRTDERTLGRLRELGAGDRYLLCGESDGTMAIPDGESMVQVAEDLFEKPEEVHAELDRSAAAAIERGARLIEAGAECLTMCSDYCFNQGPFLSPKLFAEFVTPYLHRVIEGHRTNGALVIKHTDGDIMPIVDQMVDAGPDALHSLDPQGGVDIAEIKRLYGERVALCGNVNCALMQTGTDDEVVESAEYALRHAKPGGGYVFCTSNVAFRGMPLDRYELMLDVWRRHRQYDPEAVTSGS